MGLENKSVTLKIWMPKSVLLCQLLMHQHLVKEVLLIYILSVSQTASSTKHKIDLNADIDRNTELIARPNWMCLIT